MNGTPNGLASSAAESRLTLSFEDWLRYLGIRLPMSVLAQVGGYAGGAITLSISKLRLSLGGH